MTNNPKVSIIIPTYKCPDVLEKLLVSITMSKNCDAGADYEIIVVDDCSKDATSLVAKRYTKNVVVLNENKGPAYARNYGSSIAKGDILFFLDSDVVLEEHTLKNVINYFKNNPGKLCVIGVHPKYPANPSFFANYMSLYTYYTYSVVKKDDLSSIFTPRCGAIRKDMFNTIGGFNSNYKGADVEDYEIGERIIEKCPIYVSKDIVSLHHYPEHFFKIAKNYFKRGFLWTLLFMKRKRFDNMGSTTFSEGLSVLYAGISAVSIIASIFYVMFILPFFVFLFMYCYTSLGFVRFIANEGGILFALMSLAVKYCFSIVVFVASVSAGIAYLWKKCFRIE